MTDFVTAESRSEATGHDTARPHGIQQYRLPARIFHWVTALLVLLMISSAVIAKQLDEGSLSDTLFSLHKATGALTLAVVILRICYRLVQPSNGQQHRLLLHWTLYAVVTLVPLLGWAGVSDFGSREIMPGFSLPAIWPEHAGYADLLFEVHAYLAFGLLALVALHIGVALQDYMMRSESAEPTN